MLVKERSILDTRINEQNMLHAALGMGAAALMLCPIVFTNQMPRMLKTLSLMGSIGCSATLAYQQSQRTTEQARKMQRIVHLGQEDVLKDLTAFEIAYYKLLAKRGLKDRLKQLVLKLPVEEQLGAAQEFGIQDMFNYVAVEAQTVGAAPALPSGTIAYTPIKDEVPEPSDQWIVDIAKKCAEPDPEKRRFQHLIINGGSQSGKSTLFSKLLELIIKLTSSQGAITNLIDPKYPKTRWAIEPSFIGYENVNKGVEAAIKELDDRKKKCIDARKADKPDPVFPRYFLILDEWDSVYGEGKGYGTCISKAIAEKLLRDVKRILKEAAAYDITLVLIGQSPLSKTNGLSRSDCNSACRLLLGSQALKWLKDPDFSYETAEYEAELQDMLSREARCCLIEPNMGVPYVREIPRISVELLANVGKETRDIPDTEVIPESETTEPVKAQHNPTIKPRDLDKTNDARDKWMAIANWSKGFSETPNDSAIIEKLQEMGIKFSDEESKERAVKYVKERFFGK